MKFYRFKKEFAEYGASRLGDPSFDPSSILILDDVEIPLREGSVYYPNNLSRLYVYPKEIEEVTDENVLAPFKKEMEQDIEIQLKNTKPTRGLGSFSFFRKAGGPRHHHRIACHASFNGTNQEAACTWNLFLLKKDQKEQARELIEWIMNDSPWLHCIARRWDVLSVQERTDRALEGPVPVCMDAPANEVVGFAVALRTITEHDWTLPTYLKLRELGASKAVSFMLTGHLNYDGEKFIRYPNTNWHHYLDQHHSVRGVCKFFKEGYHLPDRVLTPFNKGHYRVIAAQVADYEGDSFKNLLDSHAKEVGKGFDKIETIDIEPLLKEINSIWSEA